MSANTTSDIATSNSIATPKAMTKGEREDLQRLIKQRERVLKSAAKQRSAELLADFENQMGSEFSFDDDAVWTKATRDAEAEVARAKQRIAMRLPRTRNSRPVCTHPNTKLGKPRLRKLDRDAQARAARDGDDQDRGH